MKSAEIQGTLRELVTFRGIYIFLAVTKHSSPCSVDDDTEVKEYTGPLWISVRNRLLKTSGIIKFRAEVAQILVKQKTHSSSCSPTRGWCRRATLVYQFQRVKIIMNNFYIKKKIIHKLICLKLIARINLNADIKSLGKKIKTKLQSRSETAVTLYVKRNPISYTDTAHFLRLLQKHLPGIILLSFLLSSFIQVWLSSAKLENA